MDAVKYYLPLELACLFNSSVNLGIQLLKSLLLCLSRATFNVDGLSCYIVRWSLC